MHIFFYFLFEKVEHLLNVVSAVYYAVECSNNKNGVEKFFKVQLSQLFLLTPYAHWKAFIGKVIGIIATFIWNFMDLFVIIMSVGLSTRFKQINNDLIGFKGEVNTQALIQTSVD